MCYPPKSDVGFNSDAEYGASQLESIEGSSRGLDLNTASKSRIRQSDYTVFGGNVPATGRQLKFGSCHYSFSQIDLVFTGGDCEAQLAFLCRNLSTSVSINRKRKG